jgi:DNA helicase II / ATP-dependent DNA helicase PcrA
MDKNLILAIAGSGKTTFIRDQLELESQHLIVTYTRENIKNLRNGIIEKFGYFPENIKLYSLFSFLYSFCYKPFRARNDNPKGLYWDFPPEFTRRIPETIPLHFFSKDRRIYHNRLSKYLIRKGLLEKINSRIGKYFDHFHIDEIQDFSGYDFDILMSFADADVNLNWVGDFYQHTYDTSRDGNRNQTLHDNFENYKNQFIDVGLKIDDKSLLKSWRCSKAISEFISTQLGVAIESHKEKDTDILFFLEQDKIDKILKDNSIIKLFLKNHRKYNCYSNNWGKLKGANHLNDVCVILNKTTYKLYGKGKLIDLKPQTKNKLYVACSRANGNLIFIPEEKIEHFKIET